MLTSDGVGRDSVSDKGTVRVELKAQEEVDGPERQVAGKTKGSLVSRRSVHTLLGALGTG